MLFGASGDAADGNRRKEVTRTMEIAVICLAALCLVSVVFILPGAASAVLGKASLTLAAGTGYAGTLAGAVS